MANEVKGGVPPVTPKSKKLEKVASGEVSMISPTGNKYSGNYSKNKPASAEDPFGIL